MNIEDLIQKYENLEGVWNANGAEIARQCFLRDLEYLNKIDTKKVTVPQFVADWYEEYKDNLEYNIWDWMKYNLEPKKRENAQFSKWIASTEKHPVETLIKMKLYGYTVEKEKRYTVRMRSTKQPLFYNNMYEKIFFSMGDLATRFTRKQLEEAGLGWVFDCPGVEVEEVEG